MELTFPDIYGADRGFSVRADVLTQTADGVSLNVIWNEFQEALTEWNQGRSAFQALFSFNTTDAYSLHAVDHKNNISFEQASEFGLAKAGRAKPDYMRMGYDFTWYDLALRYTRSFLREASAEQVRSQHAAIFEADNRLVFGGIMRALTTKPADASSRPVSPEGLPIFSLWDGLSDSKPEPFGGRTFSGGHQHYFVSGAATVDGGDLKQLIDTIQEHGYGLRSSNEQIVIFVHPTDFEAIRQFRRDSENDAAHPYDFIPSVSAPAYLTDVSIIGDRAPSTYQNLSIEGSYGDAWIHKDYLVPQGYMVALASSGPGSTRNPVAFRQHSQSQNHGLILHSENASYPLVGSTYERGFGTGIENRSAAAVMQIKASGSYVNPEWPS
ncbi:hypothetical protein FVA74_08445 [Salinibacterium sp. dk2585]|uniref:hypothetical protein n=1 Tax=unclassified Salinibacterium TaxID=2632331 RepID=UPI0011C24D80|nr:MULTISPECIES: hypothetical protein [unclassified Salinibacterium]QEE61603.1 hypothetical protein FVA74_08445 [Salinibacterium sp. dk2585]TXK52312.1 hypothetical protein FVP63_13310 [Salinibacterium sp. dk5596]